MRHTPPGGCLRATPGHSGKIASLGWLGTPGFPSSWDLGKAGGGRGERCLVVSA